MNKVEIINDTVNYYSADPSQRAVIYYAAGGSTCEYATHDGKRCAVGRYLLNPKCMPIGDIETLVESGDVSDLDILLQENVRSHSSEFWNDLQSFHDENDNWNENGLTSIGREIYKLLLIRYGN